MTTFVLVHGAWHGGWCYKRVARLLRQAGHEVYTPTLTGLGERAHLMNRAIDLDTHVKDIVGVIRCEELSDVVLCGHSYGGMVITGVAEQIAAKIRSLVYLDAFVPENGKSLFDYASAERSGQMRDDATQNGEGYKITPLPAAAFAVNAQDAAWVDAMCVKQPLGDIRAEARSQWPAGTEARVHACRRLGAVALPAIRRALQGRSRLAIRQLLLRARRDDGSTSGTCRRAHRRRLGRRAHGAWWPPESGRDRIAFPTHNTHEGPEAAGTRGWGSGPAPSAHECREIQQGADHDPAHPGERFRGRVETRHHHGQHDAAASPQR